MNNVKKTDEYSKYQQWLLRRAV